MTLRSRFLQRVEQKKRDSYAALCSAFQAFARLSGALQRLPDFCRGERHVEVCNTERPQRVEHRATSAGNDAVQPDSPMLFTPSGLTLLGVGCSASRMPGSRPAPCTTPP